MTHDRHRTRSSLMMSMLLVLALLAGCGTDVPQPVEGGSGVETPTLSAKATAKLIGGFMLQKDTKRVMELMTYLPLGDRLETFTEDMDKDYDLLAESGVKLEPVDAHERDERAVVVMAYQVGDRPREFRPWYFQKVDGRWHMLAEKSNFRDEYLKIPEEEMPSWQRLEDWYTNRIKDLR